MVAGCLTAWIDRYITNEKLLDYPVGLPFHVPKETKVTRSPHQDHPRPAPSASVQKRLYGMTTFVSNQTQNECGLLFSTSRQAPHPAASTPHHYIRREKQSTCEGRASASAHRFDRTRQKGVPNADSTIVLARLPSFPLANYATRSTAALSSS